MKDTQSLNGQYKLYIKRKICLLVEDLLNVRLFGMIDIRRFPLPVGNIVNDLLYEKGTSSTA